MTSLYALFIMALVFPSLLLVIVDSIFLADIRHERVRLASENGANEAELETLGKRPSLIEWARSLAPWLLLIFAIRAFLYEPFNIPSTSMMPQLQIGDEVVVEKFVYGIKDPIFQRELLSTGAPERGDVAVFKNPEAPSLDYIKRVIGLPGDRITYINKSLVIIPNCKEQKPCDDIILTQTALNETLTDSDGTALSLFNEVYLDKTYVISRSASKSDDVGDYFNQRGTEKHEFIVPPKHYFMMGDNRDNSRDSRFFGFVSQSALVGKAKLNIIYLGQREEESALPSFIPSSVSLERSGVIK